MAIHDTIYAAPWGDDSGGLGTELSPVQSIAKAILIIDDGAGDGEIVLLTRDDDYEIALAAPDTLSYEMYTEGTRLAKITVTGTGPVTMADTVKNCHIVWHSSASIGFAGSGEFRNCVLDLKRTFSAYGLNNIITGMISLRHCVVEVEQSGSGSISLYSLGSSSSDITNYNSVIVKKSTAVSFSLGDYYGSYDLTFTGCVFSTVITMSGTNLYFTDCSNADLPHYDSQYMPLSGSLLIDGGYASHSSMYDPDPGDGTRAEWPSLGFVAPDIGVWGGPDRLSLVRQANESGSGGPMTGAAGSYLVYDRGRDIWLSFAGFNVVDGHALNYGSTIENVLLLLSSDGIVNQYPGAEISDEYCEAETGRIDVSGVSIIKSVMGDFERDRTVKMVLRNELDDGELMGVVPDARRNVWHRIAYDRSRGYRFSVKIYHALRLYKLKLEMKVRDNK